MRMYTGVRLSPPGVTRSAPATAWASHSGFSSSGMPGPGSSSASRSSRAQSVCPGGNSFIVYRGMVLLSFPAVCRAHRDDAADRAMLPLGIYNGHQTLRITEQAERLPADLAVAHHPAPEERRSRKEQPCHVGKVDAALIQR